jgi:D-glycero-alpha-D-manno-heptose-7-phosphate kinase
MYSLVDEVISSIEEEESIKRFGDLMHEGWELKKKLSSKVTNPKIDEAYEAARNAGALGGKLAGAGAGGFLFLVVPTSKKENVRSALSELSEVDFSFDVEGAQVAYYQPNMMG